jgi:arylsulfatase
MNIILISMDTTRADRLSCYGHSRLTSPHIDRVAAAGALFREHYSPHIPTYPGHTTMMTGRDLYAHRITSQSGTPELSPDIPMLAQILEARGYFTAAADNLGRWFGRGIARTWTYRWETAGKEWRKGEAVTEAVLQALQTAAEQDRPFFLFIHYWDPHTPYLPPAPFHRMFYEGDERATDNRTMDPVWAFENFKWYFQEWMPGVTDIEFPKAQYDAEIAYMDACLAHLFTRLDELGLTNETLLALTADHGEELDEHGCWFDHHGLYDPNIHIPLILRLPEVIPAGARIEGMTRMQDLTPTLLDYAGLLDPALTFDGISLRPLIQAPPNESAQGSCDILHCTENTWMKKRAVRTRRWKLIVPLETPDIHGNSDIELYDLSVDPGEKRNVAADRPEEVQRLRRAMDEWVSARLGGPEIADPLLAQPIPLRRIGRPEAPAQASPPQRTGGEAQTAQSATAAPEIAARVNKIENETKNEIEEAGKTIQVEAADQKLAAGDFVGYEREPTQKPI